MKKTFSIVMVMVIIISSFSFAYVNPKKVGEELRGLGVIKGDGSGDLMTSEKLTREQAIVLLVRLMGVEKQAAATTTTPSFNDVAKNNYYAPYIAYAEMKEWTNGIGGGKFGMAQNVTTQQVLALMLRALGYGDTPYDMTMSKAKALGLLNDVAEDGATVKIKRGNVFIIMKNTLYAKPMNSKKELVYVLGLKQPPVPEKPVEGHAIVKSVEATNLKQIIVTFSKEIPEAGNKDNYSATNEKGRDELIDEDCDFSLSKDGKVVTITLDKAVEQQKKFNFEVSGIVKEKQKFKNLQFIDQTLPKAISAEIIGIDAIKVNFSEPMNKGLTDKNNYVVKEDGGSKIYTSSVASANNDMSAIVTLRSNLDEDVVIEVSNVADYNDYKITSESFELDFKKDKTAPVIKDYKSVSLTKVILYFDEDIKLLGDKNDFYHTNKGNKASSVKVEGNALTLTFAKGSELPSGTAYIYISGDAISDYWNNKNNKMYTEVTAKADKEAPKLTGDIEVLNQKRIKLNSTEEIKKGDDYKISLVAGDDYDDIGVSTNLSDKSITIKFSKEIFGKYELKIKGVEDLVGNEMSTQTIKFDMDDEASPTGKRFKAAAYNINDDTQRIVVSFAEEMNKESIIDKDNYFYNGKSLDHKDVEISSIDGNRGVEIEIKEDFIDIKSSDVNSSNNKLLTIGRVVDASDNKLAPLSVSIDVTNGDTGKIGIKRAELVKSDVIVVTIDGELKDVTPEQIAFESGTKSLIFSKVSVETDKAGNTSIEYTFDKDLSTDPKVGYSGQLSYEVLTASELERIKSSLKVSKNVYGQTLDDVKGDVEDKCAPKVKNVKYIDDETIRIYFTEDLESDYFAAKGKNGFSTSGGTLENAVLKNDDVVELRGEDFSKSTDVSYDGNFGIADEKNNKLAEFDYTKTLSE